MSQGSPTCGICVFVNSVQDGPKKDRMVDLVRPGGMASEKATKELVSYGLKVAPTTLRAHRREEHDPLDMEETNEPDKAKAPSGWEPFSEFTDSVGSAIVKLPTPKATARDLLISAGFDPGEWQISGPINTRRWMRYDQEWLYYYKFDVVAGESPDVVSEHVDDLVAHIRTKDRKAPKKLIGGEDAFVFAASDWQIGKAEGADGTPQTIERVLGSIAQASNRIDELRQQGRKMPTLLFAGLGDLGEGTCGFYPGQQFLIDRNRREQGRINRELISSALDQLVPKFDRTIVAAVGGNHGENRSIGGSRITNDGDNDDCAYFEAVKEAFDRAGETRIEWRIMEDELTMGLTVGGVDIGLTHGHLFQSGKGSTSQQKAFEWWKGQDFGFHAVRGTKVLLSAHFHHFSATTYGARTHFQTPAMDPGSKWYRETRGEDSPPGALSFRLSKDLPLGWDDLQILQP